MKRITDTFDKPEVIVIRKALEQYWMINLKESKVSDTRKVCKDLLDDFRKHEEQIDF